MKALNYHELPQQPVRNRETKNNTGVWANTLRLEWLEWVPWPWWAIQHHKSPLESTRRDLQLGLAPCFLASVFYQLCFPFFAAHEGGRLRLSLPQLRRSNPHPTSGGRRQLHSAPAAPSRPGMRDAIVVQGRDHGDIGTIRARPRGNTAVSANCFANARPSLLQRCARAPVITGTCCHVVTMAIKASLACLSPQNETCCVQSNQASPSQRSRQFNKNDAIWNEENMFLKKHKKAYALIPRVCESKVCSLRFCHPQLQAGRICLLQ